MAEPFDDLRLGLELRPEGAVLATVQPGEGVLDLRRADDLPPPGDPERLQHLVTAAEVLRQRAPGPLTSLGAATATEGPLVAALGQRLGLPASAAPRGACLALGEQRGGAAAGVRDVLLLWLGDEIEGGLVLDGQPWSRAKDLDFAHLSAEPTGPPCACGARGCLHLYASHGSLRRWCDDLGVPRVRPAAGSTDPGLGAELATRAAAGEPAALLLLALSARAVAVAVAPLLRLTGVPLLVLAARSPTGTTPLLGPLQAELERLLPGMGTTVRSAQLGDEAVWLGAAALSG